MLHWFRAVNPVELPPGNVVSLHWQVLLFAALSGIGSSIVFGLFPAWQASRVDLNSVLKNNERGIGASASGTACFSNIGGDADCTLTHALCWSRSAGGKLMADGFDRFRLSHKSCVDCERQSAAGTLRRQPSEIQVWCRSLQKSLRAAWCGGSCGSFELYTLRRKSIIG